MDEPTPVILLVDDDQDFLAIMQHYLEAAGLRVVACRDPQSALEALERTACRLVVTDLMMASLDAGFTLAEKIKQDPRWRGLPIIMATSASSTAGFDFRPRSREDLEHMHADAFYDKALPAERLVETIRELLGRAS